MERKVSWSIPALTDVENIRDYIARDSEWYAFAIIQQLFQVSQRLTTFAERGRIVPEFNDNNIREIFVKRYRLIYQLDDTKVEIIAVIHMSRNFEPS